MTRRKKATGSRRGPQYGQPFHVETWFERDRQYVALYAADDVLIYEWWDEAVTEAIEDGFLDPRDYLGSATQYARDTGLL